MPCIVVTLISSSGDEDMNRLFSMSIRKQFFLLLVLMSAIPFVLTVISGLNQRNNEIREATTFASRAAEQIANDIDSQLSAVDQLGDTLNLLQEVKRRDVTAMDTLLGELIKSNHGYSNLSIADRSGLMWASAVQVPKGISLADRRYFKQAVATGKFSSGEYVISRTQHVPIISFGFPIKDSNGAVSNVLVASFALDQFQRYLANYAYSPSSSITLVDHNGTILYSSTSPKLVGTQDRSELFTRMKTGGNQGDFEAVGLQDVYRYFSYKKLRLEHEEQPYMYVRAGLSKQGVLERVNTSFIGNMVILLIAMLLSLAGAMLISKRGIYDRITAIRDATRKIGQGDYNTRIGDTITGGELGELAQAFDTMAERIADDSLQLKQAFEDRKESEHKYRELVENANSIILKWDHEGRIIYLNEYGERFFGYAQQELIGQHVVGTIVPETESGGRNLVDMMHSICVNPHEFINNENENIRNNGERVWVSWNNHPLTDKSGNVIGILSIGQDITRRKQVEAELQKSELRFRSFVENVNDVLFVLDTAGVFIYVSPQWKESFGYEPEETIGHPFTPYVHPDDVPGCFKFMHEVFVSGEKRSGVEYRVQCKAGGYKWYKANASMITDPDTGQPLLVGIGRDISGLREAEETLRQSEEKFSAAFHSSPDAISISRMSDATYLEVNEGFTTMTGFSSDEVIGIPAFDNNLWADPRQKEFLLDQLKHHRIAKDIEATLRRKNGTLLTGQIAARVITIEEEPYILCIIRDISESEQLQQELIKAQKLESISILAGGIAHNFNNVLTGVIGYISYAKKHLANPDKIRNILDLAEKSSYRASGLARQLLSFSQGSTPVRKSQALDPLIQESVTLFLSGTNVKGIINCASSHNVFIDSQLISQAFNNIVLNALQAMPDGGTLTVQSDSVTLKSGNRYRLAPGPYVRVSFSDTGCGIPRKHVAKVFDPYFTTKKDGTGLGLSSTHSIISKHDGGIYISSEPGTGTRVTIVLPVSQEPENS